MHVLRKRKCKCDTSLVNGFPDVVCDMLHVNVNTKVIVNVNVKCRCGCKCVRTCNRGAHPFGHKRSASSWRPLLTQSWWGSGKSKTDTHSSKILFVCPSFSVVSCGDSRLWTMCQTLPRHSVEHVSPSSIKTLNLDTMPTLPTSDKLRDTAQQRQKQAQQSQRQCCDCVLVMVVSNFCRSVNKWANGTCHVLLKKRVVSKQKHVVAGKLVVCPCTSENNNQLMTEHRFLFFMAD